LEIFALMFVTFTICLENDKLWETLCSSQSHKCYLCQEIPCKNTVYPMTLTKNLEFCFHQQNTRYNFVHLVIMWRDFSWGILYLIHIIISLQCKKDMICICKIFLYLLSYRNIIWSIAYREDLLLQLFKEILHYTNLTPKWEGSTASMTHSLTKITQVCVLLVLSSSTMIWSYWL